MFWKSEKYGLEVEAPSKTEAVIKINSMLSQMKLTWVGLSDVKAMKLAWVKHDF